VDVIKRVRVEMEQIKHELPTGLTAEIAYDSTAYINDAIHEVEKTLIDTLLIVMVVIFIFAVFLFSFIVPKFSDLLSSLNVPQPLLTRMVFGVGDVVSSTWWVWLPALLILLTTREQKSRLNFYFASAVLFMWYSVEFDTVPDVGLPMGAGLIGYMKLALLVLFLYVVTLSNRLPDVGFTFSLKRREWREALINFVLFGIIAIPFGLVTGFIKLSTTLPSLLEITGRGIAIFLFIALPEEILFRGVIHRYLERVLRWSQLATLILSSIIFGAAHLNNPPNVGYYFILAALAGIFYGRTFLRTGKVVPAALVHLAADLTWSIFFAG